MKNFLKNTFSSVTELVLSLYPFQAKKEEREIYWVIEENEDCEGTLLIRFYDRKNRLLGTESVQCNFSNSIDEQTITQLRLSQAKIKSKLKKVFA